MLPLYLQKVVELDPAVDNELLELFEDDESVPDEAKDGNLLEPFDGLH